MLEVAKYLPLKGYREIVDYVADYITNKQARLEDVERVSAEILASQFGRTRSSIYRVINEMRALRILGATVGPRHPHYVACQRNLHKLLSSTPVRAAKA